MENLYRDWNRVQKKPSIGESVHDGLKTSAGNVRERKKCNPVHTRLRKFRERAERKGMAFDLDGEWLLSKLSLTHCEVTGLKFVESGLNSPFSLTIDRHDNSIGYTKQNCKAVVWIYNQAKYTFTSDDVLRFAKALVENHIAE